jgi:hypothetical protein
MGWIGPHNVASHQPIEEHPDRSQVLFDGRLPMGSAELLDVRRDVHRCHPGELSKTSFIAPDGEALHSFEVGAAVLGFRMVTVKNSQKRVAARSPECSINTGSA